jgi:hypothetical protein
MNDLVVVDYSKYSITFAYNEKRIVVDLSEFDMIDDYPNSSDGLLVYNIIADPVFTIQEGIVVKELIDKFLFEAILGGIRVMEGS